MLYPTCAIVLNYLRYRDTSIIVKCYTEAFGAQSYLVNSVRSAKGNQKIGYYQPLSLLNLIVYHKEGSDLNRISQAQFYDASLMPSPDIRRSSIRLFLSEILSRVLQEQEPNPDKFAFIFTSLLAFEHAATHIENFHLQFLLGLAKRLGFGLSNASELYHQLYGLEVRFGSSKGLAHQEEQAAMQTLMTTPYFTAVPISNAQRRLMVDDLVRYYRIHMPDMPSIRSLDILHTLFT
jgi:DNA repair protein RecO (recombination protein O)